MTINMWREEQGPGCAPGPVSNNVSKCLRDIIVLNVELDASTFRPGNFLSFPVSYPCPVANGFCFPRYLIDQHAAGHGESGLGGKVAGDHDSKSSLRERQLVWVGRQQLIHHDH